MAALATAQHGVPAALASAPSVASHWTAGWLWGLFATNSWIHLTAPTRRHRRCEFRDLAPLVDAERLARILRDAEELGVDEERRIFDLRDFESLLARTSGHPGRGPLQQALRIYRPDPTVTRSKLERRFRALVCAASFRDPRVAPLLRARP